MLETMNKTLDLKTADRPDRLRTAKRTDQKPPYTDDGVAFTEEFKREQQMIFTAATLQPWIYSVAQQLFPELLTAEDHTVSIANGASAMTLRLKTFDPWYFGQTSLCCFGFPIGEKTWRRNWQHCGRNQSWTTDRPIKLPVLTERCYGDDEVWMSLTPMEVGTLRQHHKRCKGKVLIGGLGLGYSALRVLQSKKVTHVTVVERSAELVKLIGPQLKRQFGDRVSLITGDVWRHLGVNREARTAYVRDYDSLFLDVWKGHGGNKEDPNFELVYQEACRNGRVATAWG